MPSSKNLIQSLRSAHDPHFKLEGRVGGLEKGLGIQVAQLHKTMSKSFGMQRKTLVRVLALEKKVAELEAEREAAEEVAEAVEEAAQAVEEAAEAVEEVAEELGVEDEIPEGLDDLLDDVRGEKEEVASAEEVGGTTTPKKPTATATKKRKPRIRLRKSSISAAALKKGTALDDDFASRVMGKNEKGEYLSKEERIARFKKTIISSDDLKSSGADADAEKGGASSKGSENLIGSLKTIDNSVNGIIEVLKDSNKEDADARADARKEDEKKKRKKSESKLEGVGAGLIAAGDKILAPIKSIWSKILDFIQTIFFGNIALKLWKWFANPANSEKVASVFRFLKDWWPVLVAGIMAVVGPGITFTVGLVALLMWGVPKIIDAVKWVGSLFGIGVKKEIDNIGKESEKANADIGKDIESDLTKDTDKILNDAPDTDKKPDKVVESEQNAQNLKDRSSTAQEPKKFATGGFVSGPGGVDRVPAKLTAGEFVMSKGAVQKYGANTLAAMNAAGGGTNKPTVGRYNEGGVITDPEVKKQQEAYMLKFVNEERAMQGLEPLNNLTYAPGVELTKPIGPGPKTNEQSHTDFDFDKGIKTTSKSKTVDGKLTDFGGSMSQITPEDRQQFFAENPHAAQLVMLKDQMELDNLGADISASAKMNGGGLVQKFVGGGLVQGFSGGGLVQKFAGGGPVARAKIYPKKSSLAPISPPSSPVYKIAMDSTTAQSQKTAAIASNDQDLPQFSASAMRSGSKIKTLGISV
jgi:hypothetical protein